MTYALPNLVVVLSPPGRWTPTPFNYGRLDKPAFAAALASQLYLAVLQAFPPMKAWTAASFNYNWVVTGAVLAFATLLYLVRGRHTYQGIDLDAVRRLQTGQGPVDGVPVLTPVASSQATTAPRDGKDGVTKLNSTTKM